MTPITKLSDDKLEYYVNDKLHRDDGPAVVYHSGSKFWYQHGRRHREDGPAIELWTGTKEWFNHGVRHREDGPAIIWSSGLVEWWIDGRLLTENQFKQLTQSEDPV